VGHLTRYKNTKSVYFMDTLPRNEDGEGAKDGAQEALRQVG